MPRTAIIAFQALISLALPVAPAMASHNCRSDKSEPLQLSGTVTAASRACPHATSKLDVEGKRWRAVLAPPSRLSSHGIGSDDIKVGDRAIVEGYPGRRDATEMRAERITLVGKVCVLR